MNSRYAPIYAAFVVAALTLTLVLVEHVREVDRTRQQQRSEILGRLGTTRAMLEGGLNSRVYLNRSMAVFVGAHPDLSDREFQAMAVGITSQHTGIMEVELAKDSIITHVHPTGKYQILGLNLLTDLPEAQRPALHRAIASGQTVVTPPVSLVEGGSAVISRTPVFISLLSDKRAGQYWGLANLLIDPTHLFEEAGLVPAPEGLDIALGAKDGNGGQDVFFGDPLVFETNPVRLDLTLPGNVWTIAAAPTGGWLTVSASTIPWLRAIITPSLAGVLAWLLFFQMRQRLLAQEQYRDLVHSARTCILRLDKDGRVLFLNEYGQRFFGWTQDEIVGQPLLGTLVPHSDSDGAEMKPFVQELLSHPERFPINENENVLRNGNTVWISWANRPIYDSKGAVLEILSVGTDITSKKILEGTLRRDAEHFRMLLQGLPFPVLITNLKDGRLLYGNRRLRDIFDQGDDDITSLYSTQFFADPADRERLLTEISEHGTTDAFEIQLNGPDGHTFWAILSIRTIDFEGQPALFTALNDITARKAHEASLMHLANTDGLTGLPNRQHFLSLAEKELARCMRYKHPVSLLMLDADHFKQVNDTHGHHIGDMVLQNFASVFDETLRDVDTAGRIGGEEFAILLPETDAPEARAVAERLRATMEQRTLHSSNAIVTCTMSVGVVTLPPDGKTPLDRLMQCADEALYRAKQNGRNCVEVA